MSLAERPIIEEITRRPVMEDVSNEVIILGAGISGMLAAWACDQRDRSFVIIDRGPPEALPMLVRGCVYLHEHCDLERHLRRQDLRTIVLPYDGPREGDHAGIYHRKVWGDTIPYETNSIDRYVGTSLIYSMNDALRHLHRRYRDYIDYAIVDWSMVRRWLDMGCKVISTIPLGALFPAVPRVSRLMWTWQSEVDEEAGSQAYAVYNIDPDTAWYRMSSMFGNMSIEFIRPPAGDWKVAKFKKIVSADMSMVDKTHPHLMLTGRWGRWQRGFLSHMAYRAVCQKFDSGEWR